jgi:hypothetical protein
MIRADARPPGQDGAVVLMALLGVVLVVGIVLTLWWGGTPYQPWEPDLGADAERSDLLRTAVLRYLRGLAIGLVGGFWAGALVTGPAVRLVMRLLAVTAGDNAQGRITEADEVVGSINLDGTIGLWIFGGVLPGLLSGGIYMLLRRWLPTGHLGGIAFGGLHLLVAATRLDPLRPENPDFDIVGPGWLSVTTFVLATFLHGMAVAAIANRYSRDIAIESRSREALTRTIVPLVLPALLFVLAAVLVIPVVVGLLVAVVASQIAPVMRVMRSRGMLLAGRVALAVLALALLPSALSDLRHVVDRDLASHADPRGRVEAMGRLGVPNRS